METSNAVNVPTLSASCRGRMCATPLGLDLRHFHPLHTVQCFALISASFLMHWWLAYSCMHPAKGPMRRCAWAVALTTSYCCLLFWGVPWHPYWIRELHVMAAMLSAWKLAELALLREGEALRRPWTTFLSYDAMCLRPDLALPAARLGAAPEVEASLGRATGENQEEKPMGGWLRRRLLSAAPVLALAGLQYLGVEALNSFLMHQPRDILPLSLARRVLLSCCFAACLYLHLSYFFWSVCAAAVVARGDAVSEWVAPFNHPYAACSPVDFWSHRWHSMFRWHFVQLVYRPVQTFVVRVQGGGGKGTNLAKALPTLAVFLASGLFHELLLWINFGASTGEQLAFFLIHAMVLLAFRYLQREVPGRRRVVELQAAAACGVCKEPPDALRALASGASPVQGKRGPNKDVGSGPGRQRGRKQRDASGRFASTACQRSGAVPAPGKRADGRYKGSSAGVGCSATVAGFRHALHVLAFNAFLALTLVLFFAPWFRYGYHQELRVFVPGPVHYWVKAALHKWQL